MADDRPRPAAFRLRQTLDTLVYSVAFVAVLVAGAAVVSVPLGAGWVGVKYALFFVGFFLFGLSALRLRPTPPWKDEDGATTDERTETRFQAAVQRLPPLTRYGLAPDERLPPPAKLFVASVLVLLTSFVMETGFGVAA
jgi:hypothetical protein